MHADRVSAVTVLAEEGDARRHMPERHLARAQVGKDLDERGPPCPWILHGPPWPWPQQRIARRATRDDGARVCHHERLQVRRAEIKSEEEVHALLL